MPDAEGQPAALRPLGEAEYGVYPDMAQNTGQSCLTFSYYNHLQENLIQGKLNDHADSDDALTGGVHHYGGIQEIDGSRPSSLEHYGFSRSRPNQEPATRFVLHSPDPETERPDVIKISDWNKAAFRLGDFAVTMFPMRKASL